MTNEEMRIAVAQGAGWKNVHWYEDDEGPAILCGIPPLSEEEIFKLPKWKLDDLRKFGKEVPDYPSDLNATREIVMKMNVEERRMWVAELLRITDRDSDRAVWMPERVATATAAQSTEAWLRAKELYSEPVESGSMGGREG